MLQGVPRRKELSVASSHRECFHRGLTEPFLEAVSKKRWCKGPAREGAASERKRKAAVRGTAPASWTHEPGAEETACSARDVGLGVPSGLHCPS